ncbi:hypothetical protein ACFL4Z_03000 [candidate division KSB1 bacterium]
MKKLIIFAMVLCINITYGQRKAFIINERYLETIYEDKLNADTTRINLRGTLDLGTGDSVNCIIAIDTLKGQDEVGTLPAVKLRYIPVFGSDTINTGGKTITDSILSFGNARKYTFPAEYTEYDIIIEYNFGDTSCVGVGTKVKWNGIIFLK